MGVVKTSQYESVVRALADIITRDEDLQLIIDKLAPASTAETLNEGLNVLRACAMSAQQLQRLRSPV
jgi:hypothetical protein